MRLPKEWCDGGLLCSGASPSCSVWFRLSTGLDRPNSSSRTRSTQLAATALPPTKHNSDSAPSTQVLCRVVSFVGETTADFDLLGQWVTLICEFVRKCLQDPIKSEFGRNCQIPLPQQQEVNIRRYLIDQASSSAKSKVNWCLCVSRVIWRSICRSVCEL